MKNLKLVNQPTPFTCTSACIAMFTGLNVDLVVSEFHEKYFNREISPIEYLKEKSITLIPNTNPFNHCIDWGNLYLLTVASLNIEGGLHHIVVDTRGDIEIVLDPNNGKPNKKYYVGWSKCKLKDLEVNLKSWNNDGNIIYDN